MKNLIKILSIGREVSNHLQLCHWVNELQVKFIDTSLEIDTILDPLLIKNMPLEFFSHDIVLLTDPNFPLDQGKFKGSQAIFCPFEALEQGVESPFHCLPLKGPVDKSTFLSVLENCLRICLLNRQNDHHLESIKKSQIDYPQPLELMLSRLLDQSYLNKTNGALVIIEFSQMDHIMPLAHRLFEGFPVSFHREGQRLFLAVETVESEDSFVALLGQLQNLIHRDAVLRQPSLPLTVDFGVSFSRGHITHPKRFIEMAEQALFQCQRKGHGFVEVYHSAVSEQNRHEATLEGDLKIALEDRQFFMVYQPFVDLRSMEILGYEALVRWHHPRLGILSPDQFLPLMEKTNTLVHLGEHVQEMVFEKMADWAKIGRKMRMSINLTSQELLHPHFIRDLTTRVSRFNISPQLIDFEIVEKYDLNESVLILRRLHELKDMGFGLVIDDFGVGFSSLHYLSEFPVDKIKIDRSFMVDVTPSKKRLLEGVIKIADSMGILTLAEGIETPTQHSMVRELGVHQSQGFLYGRPIQEPSQSLNITTQIPL